MAAEVSLEFITGNPQLGVLSGRLTYLDSNAESPNSDELGDPNVQPEEKQEEEEEEEEEEEVPTRLNSSGSSSSCTCGDLPKRRGTLLCILSVPAHMIPTDMLQFAAPFKEHVHFIRIIRPCNSPLEPSGLARTPAEYMVLLQMDSQASADDFFLQCNGKRFNSFEEACCGIVFVATATFDLSAPATTSTTSITATSAATIPSPPSLNAYPRVKSPADDIGSGGGARCDSPVSPVGLRAATVMFEPVVRQQPHGGGAVAAAAAAAAAAVSLSADVDGTAWAYDASTCVICMDRMETHVLTTVCNHSFHVECLVKWQDSPCPVCRFHHNNATEASTCQECQATDNLWVCLICGSVLCGSRHEDHVRGHYINTLHAYAIEIETQQVWDFAGDGFVHRLIHNKADGKLVEIPDPGQTSEERPQVPARLSDVQEERLVHGKLEGLAYQYNTLLTSQLDAQRHFYEKQLNGLLEQQEKDRRERRARIVSGADLINALRQQRRELESKCASASDRLRKTREETSFLWELNRSLEANREQLSTCLAQAQEDMESASKTREELVPKLEEKVMQLMLKLDTSAAVAAAASAVTVSVSEAMVGSSGTGSTGSNTASSDSSGGGGGGVGAGLALGATVQEMMENPSERAEGGGGTKAGGRCGGVLGAGDGAGVRDDGRGADDRKERREAFTGHTGSSGGGGGGGGKKKGRRRKPK